MKMYTASLQKLEKLRKEYSTALFVSIARGINCAKACDGVFKHFAPTQEILDNYKRTGDWAEYEKQFKALLAEHDLKECFKTLRKHAIECGKDTIILVCYEKENTHCHRRLVAEAYNELGCHITELS